MRKGRILSEQNDKKIDENLNEGLKIVLKHKENLNKQREKRKNKKVEKVENSEENNTYLKVRPVVLGIIFSVVILIIFMFINYGPFIGISLNRDTILNENNKIDILSSDYEIFDTYCSDLLIYNNQKIETYNSRGVKNWEYELPSQFNPKIYIKDRFMIISNNSSGKIYLFENKKEILNTKIDGTISEIYLDETGNYVVEYSSSGYKNILGVYNKKGKSLYNAYLSTESLIDVKMIQNGKQLITFNLNTSTFKTVIDVCLIDSSSTNEIKTIATIDNNCIYNLTIQNRNIIMLLDDKIVKCNIDTGEVANIYSFDTNQLMYISLSKNYYSVILKELNENNNSYNNGYAVLSNRFDNTSISRLDIMESPKIMKTSSVLNYFIYQNKLQVVNKWGLEVKSVEIEFPPKDVVIFNNSKSIALVYTNKVYVANI